MTTAAVAAASDAPAGRRPTSIVLIAIGLAGCAAAAVSALLPLWSDTVSYPEVRAVLGVWVVLPYALAGLLAWRRRPESRLGLLMLAAGLAFFLSSLASAHASVPYTIGIAFDLVPAVLFLHVFLAFPSGRLAGRAERILVGIAYGAALPAQLAGMLLGGFGPDNLLAVTSSPEAAYELLRAQLVVLSACCVGGIGLLVARRLGAGRPHRRSLGLLVDSFVLGLLMVAVLFVSGAYGLIEGEAAFEWIRRSTFIILGLAPLAFLVALLDARLARANVGRLVVQLRAELEPAALQGALARALRDPSLRLRYWLTEFDSWADNEGRPVELPADDPTRATTVIERDGGRVAALIHDPALLDEPELLNAVTAAAEMALDNARLQAELRARLEELRGSRARIVEAEHKERQRLERNLHDGAQQRLVALSLQVSLLEQQAAGDAELRERLEQVREEIAASLDELRTVARGIHPAVVSGHGLEVALEQLAARAPVPVELRLGVHGRLPEAIEVAVFYVVSESLANIGKHAHATAATVTVDRLDGLVVLEVVDDGVGGADSERGTGLRGLADRVEALEGRLRVWSPSCGGTRLRAEIPCAS
jgi:signal transduction histidine kinase